MRTWAEARQREGEPAERAARSLAIIGRMPTTARLIVWVLGLGLLAVSLYLAPLITVLALAVSGLGLPLLVLLWSRPEFGLLAIIFLTSSFVPADIVDLRLPIGGGFELRDLVLLGMLGLLILRGLTRGRLAVPWRPVGLPLLVFLGFGLLSAWYALSVQGVEPNWALNDLRILMYYAVFFVTGWAITRRRQLSVVLAGLFCVADLTAGIVFIQQFLGADNRLLAAMSGTHWHLYQQTAASDGLGAVRIVPPGHLLMFFMMVIALCLMLFGRHSGRLRAIFALQFVYLNFGLLLTYTRAQWIAAAVALGVIAIVLLPRYKAQLARHLVMGMAVLLLAVSAYGVVGADLGDSIDNLPFVNALIARVASIFTPSETLESSSLEWRLFEADEALRSISQQPLLGVGLGNSYRDVTLLRGEARGQVAESLLAGERSRFTRYVHNSYLSIAAKMGLPALICLLWFLAVLLIKGWRLYRNLPESPLRAVVLAVVAGFAGLLLWSVFHSHLVDLESTSVVGVMAGLIAATDCVHRRGLGTSSTHGRTTSRIADVR